MWQKIDDLAGQISLGNLIRGFSNYFKVFILIILNIRSFPEKLSANDDEEFKKSNQFITYAIILSFFILIPVYAAHQESITKLIFFVRLLTNYAIWGLLLHFLLSLVGRQKVTFKRTMCVYSYIMGLGLPSYLLLALPILIKTGPIGVFGSFEESQEIAFVFQENPGLLAYYSITLILFAILSWIIMLSWLSKSHHISKVRVFFSLVLASIIGSIIQLLIVNPFFNSIYNLLDYWFSLIF